MTCGIEFPCGRDDIQRILPHRDPFLWMTRVVECDPGSRIVAELDVDPALPLFNGHFPDHPVLPGVIIMEALAQAASFCELVGRDAGATLGFLTGIDNAKFRRQVRPGDTLRLEGRIVKRSSRMCVAEVRALVEGEVCASATQKYVLASAGAASGQAAQPEVKSEAQPATQSATPPATQPATDGGES